MAPGNNNELLKSVAVEWRKRDCYEVGQLTDAF